MFDNALPSRSHNFSGKWDMFYSIHSICKAGKYLGREHLEDWTGKITANIEGFSIGIGGWLTDWLVDQHWGTSVQQKCLNGPGAIC